MVVTSEESEGIVIDMGHKGMLGAGNIPFFTAKHALHSGLMHFFLYVLKLQ